MKKGKVGVAAGLRPWLQPESASSAGWRHPYPDTGRSGRRYRAGQSPPAQEPIRTAIKQWIRGHDAVRPDGSAAESAWPGRTRPRYRHGGGARPRQDPQQDGRYHMVAEADSASGRTSTPATSSSMSGSAGPDMPANGRLGAMCDSGCTARVPAAGLGVADPEGVMIPEGAQPRRLSAAGSPCGGQPQPAPAGDPAENPDGRRAPSGVVRGPPGEAAGMRPRP